MGYFNGYENWKDYAENEGLTRRCTYCGKEFVPNSPNQKRHVYDSDNDAAWQCAMERELEEMSPRQYLSHVGMTKQEYISTYGIEQYEAVVLKKK